MADAIAVTVKSDLLSAPEVLPIANYPIKVLPETGGIGTKRITTIGILMLVLPIALMIGKKKGEMRPTC